MLLSITIRTKRAKTAELKKDIIAPQKRFLMENMRGICLVSTSQMMAMLKRVTQITNLKNTH